MPKQYSYAPTRKTAVCENCGRTIYFQDNGAWYHLRTQDRYCTGQVSRCAYPKGEKKMTGKDETVELRKDDLMEAYLLGCAATKAALARLYPKVFAKEPEKEHFADKHIYIAENDSIAVRHAVYLAHRAPDDDPVNTIRLINLSWGGTRQGEQSNILEPGTFRCMRDGKITIKVRAGVPVGVDMIEY